MWTIRPKNTSLFVNKNNKHQLRFARRIYFYSFKIMNAIKINAGILAIAPLVTDVQLIKRTLRLKNIFSHKISSIKAFVIITTTNVESEELFAKGYATTTTTTEFSQCAKHVSSHSILDVYTLTSEN